jgi:rhodanese-related sulfurtransferase
MKSNNLLHVHAKDAYAQYITGHAVIIDVREPEARQIQPKVKQLVKVPLSQLDKQINQLPVDKAVYVLSGKGKSAASAVTVLKEHGYNAKDIYEGIIGWEQYGLPTEVCS